MKDETRSWLEYSSENLEAARLSVERELYNVCLQNIQQAVEKALKAVMIEKEIRMKKTHSITDLKNILRNHYIIIELSDEDAEFLDSIYLPSKYPLGSALPFYDPNVQICRKGITIAESVLKSVTNNIERI